MATIVADIIYQTRERGMTQVTSRMRGIERQATSSSGAVSNLGSNLRSFIPLAVIAASVKLTGVLADLGREAASVGDEIVKTSSKLGLSTKELQRYRFAASEAGVKQNTLDMAFQRFTRRTAEARKGTGELVKGLDMLGIKLTTQDGKFKSNVELFEEYITKMRQMKDSTDRTLVAFKGFDSGGVALVNLELEHSAKLFEEMGTEIDESVLKKLAIVNNELGLMAIQQANLGTEIGAAFGEITVIIEQWQYGILSTIYEVVRLLGLVSPTLKELKSDQLEALADLAEAEDKYNNAKDNRQRNSAARAKQDAAERLSEINKQIAATSKIEKKKPSIKLKTPSVVSKLKPSGLSKSSRSSTATSDVDDFDMILKRKTQALERFYEGTRELQISNIQNESQRLLEQHQLDQVLLLRKRDTLLELEGLTRDDEIRIKEETASKKLEIETEYQNKLASLKQQELAVSESTAKKDLENKIAAQSSLQKWAENTKSLSSEVSDIAVTGFESMADGFADFATGSDQSFSEFASSFLKQVSKMIIKMLLLQAIKSAVNGIFGDGGTFGTTSKNAKGNTFGTTKFAAGGDFTNSIVRQPTKFAFGGGLGLMGEAGPEAIMPLSRDSSGTLGVKMTGGGGNSGGGIQIGSINVTLKENDSESSDEQSQRIGKAIKTQLTTMIDGRITNANRSGNINNPTQVSNAFI